MYIFLARFWYVSTGHIWVTAQWAHFTGHFDAYGQGSRSLVFTKDFLQVRHIRSRTTTHEETEQSNIASAQQEGQLHMFPSCTTHALHVILSTLCRTLNSFTTPLIIACHIARTPLHSHYDNCKQRHLPCPSTACETRTPKHTHIKCRARCVHQTSPVAQTQGRPRAAPHFPLRTSQSNPRLGNRVHERKRTPTTGRPPTSFP